MQGTGLTRKALIRRVISYTLMVVAVLAIATVLIFLMLGYRFNRYNGTIQQGGLVQFISQPSGASIKVGDILLAKKTRSKITLTPGNYLVTMQKDGYHDWTKNVTVKAGAVLWLNSVRFVPNNPETKSVLTMKTLGSMSVHENTIALLRSTSRPTLSLVDIHDDTVRTQDVTIPNSVLDSKAAATYKLDDWLSDRYVLLERTIGRVSDWVVVDTDSPADSIVVTGTKKHLPLEVASDPRSSGAVLIRYSDGTVASETISSQKITKLPLENVATISSDGNTLFYVTLPHGSQVSTGYLTLGDGQARTLRTYETNKVVQIASGRYFSTRYVATSVGTTTYIDQLASLPSSDDQAATINTVPFKTITTPSKVLFSSFKANGRFVTLQQKDDLTTFDIELMKQSDVPIVGAKKLAAPLEWFDQFHFWSDTNGYLRQYEFDGTNQADILAVAPGFSASYSSNGKYLYTIGKVANGYTLQQTKMIVD